MIPYAQGICFHGNRPDRCKLCIALLSHPVFQADLAAGVAAVARAIGVRQAQDMLRVAEQDREDWSAQSQNAHIFPTGDCCTAILEICSLARRALAEEGIQNLDMSPITDLVRPFADRPLRPHWTTPHDWLSTLAELSLGMHLTIEYTTEEVIAVRRLFAAIHLTICGPLPVGNWGADDRQEIVGCPECLANHHGRNGAASLPTELAFGARDGDIDPAYTPLLYPDGWTFGMPTPSDNRPRAARLTWHVADGLAAKTLRDILEALGFAVAENPGWGILVAQKPLLKGDVHDGMRWGSRLTKRLKDLGVEWYGAQTIFSLS